MRLHIRNQLLEILPTIADGVTYAKKADISNAKVVLEECLFAINTISDSLQRFLSEMRFEFYNDLITKLIDAIDDLFTEKGEGKSASEPVRKLKKYLHDLKKALLEEQEVKLEVLFLPYKSSMWDSLESIWIAADKDPRCNCYVMPIPYYDRNSEGNFAEFHYEGDQFPKNVPITHYTMYDIENSRPDIIYIHNPYDGINYVTSVHPNYYSDKLKQYTDMLVYVPYFIAATMFKDYEECKTKPYHMYPGVNNSNLTIVQSDVFKNAMLSSGCSSSKLRVLGSPKLDAVINSVNKVFDMPNNWHKKLDGKKVFFVNSSITNLLTNGLAKFGEEDIFSFYNKILDTLLENENCGVIWRPHPLLETTINTMKPEFKEKYNIMKERIINSDNAVYDDSPDFYPALVKSDALITDASSIPRLYMATGKPIIDVTNSSNFISKFRYYALDYSACYFYWDGVSIDKFVNMVLTGEDPKREERLMRLKKSVVNTDGSCGQKVHDSVSADVWKKSKM